MNKDWCAAEKKDEKETFPHVLASYCASLPNKKTKKTIRESVKWLVINNTAHVGEKKKQPQSVRR